jgi:predicted ATPase/DNA-binding SARP family transcriptional activator
VLTVALLGAVEVRLDGVPLPVPTGKTTELLVRLALDAGVRVRADTLLDDLWPEGAGRNTLQSKVSQLRRALGDRDLVAGSGDGYTLALDRGCVDAFRVADLAAEAAAAREAGDTATALDRATRGLALYRGDALVDLGDWAVPHRARFDELRMALVEDAMAARVALGSGGEVVGELEALVERHPLRERLWAALVTALYRAGRQADALAAYTRVRTVLVDELGIEPGEELRALEQQVLQQSPVLRTAAAGPAVASPGNLPPVPAPLVGRADDAGALGSLLREWRLVSVAGPAGVGKTRVALEVAQGLRASGGVWLVRLEAANASSDLAQVVAETLHVPAGGRGLVDRLAGAETVLLLDNCEHVVESAGALVGSLVDSVPGLRILTTSQVPLGIEGECVHHLEPLSLEDSVTLFSRRAQELRRQFVLDADTRTLVEEVCGSLDGLPLAIELAAARVRSLSVRDIARRLDDRFAVLQDPSSHRPERRRALAGAIGWSYDLLFPDDQRGLWALSCFAGSASLDAVEHVLTALGVPSGAVVDTVTRLVDRSLVSVDDAAGGAVRYRLLDSIRAYAADRLREAGQAQVARAAHAAWYAGLAAWCDARVRGDRQPECLAVARAERANVDAALAWCAGQDPALGARIGIGFGWTWVVLGDGTAGAARVRGALTSATAVRDRATGLLLAGWLESSAGDVTLAQADLDAARLIADGLDDDLLRADVHRHQAFVSLQRGHPDRALSAASAGLGTYRALGLGWQSAGSLLLAAFGSLMLGDTAAAARDAGAAVTILTPIGDSWALVHAEAMLAGVAQAEHRFEDAARALANAADRSRALGFVGQAALHLATLARVQHRAGDTDQAIGTFDRAIAAALAGGDGRLAATARLNLARLLRARGDVVRAVSLLEQNLRWYEHAGGGDGALLTRCLLCAETRDAAGLSEVLDEADTVETQEVRVYALDALAHEAATRGDDARAEQLLAEADALTAAVAHLVDDGDRLDGARARDRLAGPPG